MITPIDQRIHCRVFKLIISGIIVVSLAACGLTAPRSSAGFADLESLGMSEIMPQQFSDVMVALDVETPGAEVVQPARSEES